MIYRFTIEGRPVGKQRPRLGRGRRAYTPRATHEYEAKVAGAAKHRRIPNLDGPVKVAIVVGRRIPKSWSKSKAERALAKVWAIAPGDLDNIAKSLLDGMNGVCYKDDSQVVDLSISRVWTVQPDQVTVEISDLG